MLGKEFKVAVNTEAEALLLQWFRWWEETDEAPAKMPDSLHTKTAVYFTEKRCENFPSTMKRHSSGRKSF